jgi:HKD family nuclease
VRVRLITEGKVKEHIVDVLEQTTAGDDVYVGMFYLSERDIIEALKEAAQRGAAVKLVLDPNKDAFGREKNGVPNRPVAHELVNSTGGNIQVKWYDTQGEQFHTKMLMVLREEESIVIGGSANFTRRNVDDINLETNLRIDAPHDSAVIQDVNQYFNRIWENEDGQYTLPYEAYAEDSQWKYWLYRFQEWSGLSSF